MSAKSFRTKKSTVTVEVKNIDHLSNSTVQYPARKPWIMAFMSSFPLRQIICPYAGIKIGVGGGGEGYLK